MSPRDVHMPRSSRWTRSRPFVVCSTNTKRYAPPLSTKPPAIQLQRFPLRTAAIARPSVSPGPSTNQKARSGSSRIVVPKAKPSHASASLHPAPIPAPSNTTKTLRLPIKGNSRHEKTSSMLKPTQTSRGDKASRFRASLESTRDDLPPRPSCIPRSRISQTSSGIPATGRGKPDVAIKVAAAGARNRGAGCEVSVNTYEGKTVRCTQVSDTIADWSPPPSPNLSSFPSQTWTIVVSADAKRNKTSMTICSDETPSTVDDEPKSSEEGTEGAPATDQRRRDSS
ncbi:hypothetical protein JVU11DRAFT_9587 [Chiua virens]|nr:hypothetical protein JVU11DRAFT_9587 [Chiua virens]